MASVEDGIEMEEVLAEVVKVQKVLDASGGCGRDADGLLCYEYL